MFHRTETSMLTHIKKINTCMKLPKGGFTQVKNSMRKQKK